MFEINVDNNVEKICWNFFIFIFSGVHQQIKPGFPRSFKKEQSKYGDDLSISQSNVRNGILLDQSKSKSLKDDDVKNNAQLKSTAVQSNSAVHTFNQSGLRMADTIDQSRARNVSFLLNSKILLYFVFVFFALIIPLTISMLKSKGI